MNHRKIIKITIISLLVFFSLSYGAFQLISSKTKDVKVEAKDKAESKKNISKSAKIKDDKDMTNLRNFTYHDSSEKKAYPDLNSYPKAWIDVDIATQRMYVKDGEKTLYEMYASTGKKDATPRGTYYVQGERGEFFYTAPLKLGAYYWVSFLNHGEYLFHTTPTDEQGNYVESIAKTLGREPSSHGCIHLSSPDCKWIYENIPYNTKVVIHGEYKG